MPYHLKNECTGEEASGSGGSGSDQTTVFVPAATVFPPFSGSPPSQASNNRNRRASTDVLDLVVQTGDTVHQSLSRTKRLSKYASMNDNNSRRNSLNFIKTSSSHGSAGGASNDEDMIENLGNLFSSKNFSSAT